MKTNQTVINWIIQQIDNKVIGDGDYRTLSDIFNQAKAMEKDQINKAWEDGFRSTAEGWNGEIPPECQGEVLDTEEYYNETYGTPVDKKG